jgi:hypothetical protein
VAVPLVCLLSAACVLSVVAVAPASATGTVAWSVRSIADPTHFSPNDAAECSSSGVCDRYQLVVRNVGDETSKGKITVTDTLPLPPVGAASSPEHEPHFTEFGAEGWECASEVVAGRATVTCKSEKEVAPEAYVQNNEGEFSTAVSFTIPVVAPSATTGTLKNEVTVTGGGASTAGSTVEETASISTKPPGFEVTDFSFEAINVGGGVDTQAGTHPYDVTASFDLADVLRPHEEAQQYANPVEPVENPRAAVVELPVGFLGDPQATPTCSESTLTNGAPEGRSCPPASRVGVATVDLEGSLLLTGGPLNGSESAIYNIAPQAGYPAEFAVSTAAKMIPMYASVVHTSSGYRVRVSAPGIPAAQGPVGVSLTFFGNPAAVDKTGGRPVAFVTNPADCSGGPLSARIELDSWENPGRWVSKEATTYPQVSGCNVLQFNPSIELAPSTSSEGGTTQADEPSGYNVDLKVPQIEAFSELATPELKDATVTLPEGVSVSPSAADGLEGCRETGPEGINIGSSNPEKIGPGGQDLEHPEATELGAGQAGGSGSPYDDGFYHTAHGHCPLASTLGTVEVFTPLLPTRCGGEGQAVCKPGESAAPLQGRVFLAQPKCGGAGQPACTEASATNGELFGGYIEVEGSGVIVKLQGTIIANPATGQLTGTFKENPQLPFSDLKLHFHGGPRALLANPQGCGAFTTTSDLVSWSSPATADATPSSSFPVTGCAASMGFAPSFTAGTITPAAGAFSPFVLSFSRQDREQDFSGFTFTTPPGLLANLSSVPACAEPQAAQGECGQASEVGAATVAAGAGSEPIYLSGHVYLTGPTLPYNGQPFGLSIVVPATIGPFDLGAVVVRASITVNPATAALTIATGPLPQTIDGVPLRLRTINVDIDRPEFIFNPTSCEPLAVNATISSVQGASASVSSPFAVGGCKNLPFSPKLTALTRANGEFAGHGASLHVVITTAAGQANMRSLKVDLPQRLPARLETIQHACPEAVFDANPAACPQASVIGSAAVQTPILSTTMAGPAYLVSKSGSAASHPGESAAAKEEAAFPDLVLVLQGEGVRIDLTGALFVSVKNITSVTFRTIPDVPIRRLDLILPEGKTSILAASSSVCTKKPLTMFTAITGQNGARLKPTVTVAVEGCKRAKRSNKKRHPTKRRDVKKNRRSARR